SADSPSQAQYVFVDVNHIRVAVSSGDGYLVVLDPYWPGWTARLDGRPVEIYRADYLFRAVRVAQGDHVLEMTYEPASVRTGALITGVGLVVLSLSLAWPM